MREWRAGDPIGAGRVYLPDTASREAYGRACRDQVIESAARTAIALPDIEARRAYINRYPAGARDALKAKVSQLWRKKDGGQAIHPRRSARYAERHDR